MTDNKDIVELFGAKINLPKDPLRRFIVKTLVLSSALVGLLGYFLVPFFLLSLFPTLVGVVSSYVISFLPDELHSNTPIKLAIMFVIFILVGIISLLIGFKYDRYKTKYKIKENEHLS